MIHALADLEWFFYLSALTALAIGLLAIGVVVWRRRTWERM